MEKALETDCCGWDFGGRIDLLYGSDYRFTLARGLDAEDDFTARWDNEPVLRPGLPQAYWQLGNGTLGSQGRPLLHDHRI